MNTVFCVNQFYRMFHVFNSLIKKLSLYSLLLYSVFITCQFYSSRISFQCVFPCSSKNICFNYSGELAQLSVIYVTVRRIYIMIKLTTISILGLGFILDLKKRYDKTLKNIPTGSSDLLRFVWKYGKVMLIM